MTVDYQKVWQTMNDLEMVTTKICSAREIIDAAIDRIQEHQNDKAEIMMTAAYEFLEYYLIEFDEKFKDAWKATVGDLRDGDVAKQFDYTATGEKFPQYTEEELNAMCDAAAEQEERDKCREYNLREAEYYNKRALLDAEYEAIKAAGGYEWTPEPPKEKKKTYDEMVAEGWTMTADGFWIRE